MGVLDWITGARASTPGVAPVSAAALRESLLAINRETAPFIVRDGAPEGVDLVAEWRIVDARWYEFFAKAGVERVFKVVMKFDETRGEVRSVDQEWEVEWRAGVPSLALSGSASRGQKWEMSFESVYAFREEDLTWGKVYEYRFRTSEIKGPLIAAVRAAGWRWRGIAFSRL